MSTRTFFSEYQRETFQNILKSIGPGMIGAFAVLVFLVLSSLIIEQAITGLWPVAAKATAFIIFFVEAFLGTAYFHFKKYQKYNNSPHFEYKSTTP